MTGCVVTPCIEWMCLIGRYRLMSAPGPFAAGVDHESSASDDDIKTADSKSAAASDAAGGG